MPELSRAHDTSTAAVAYDGVAGDVKEGDVSDIADGVAGLKVDDGMPTATIVSDSPIEPLNNSSGVEILVHLLKAKDEIRRLEKENEELKKANEMLKAASAPTESASPPTKNA